MTTDWLYLLKLVAIVCAVRYAVERGWLIFEAKRNEEP